MTAEELVIAHYEQTLDPGQEAELAAMLEGSPDVRALYEQHGRIQSLLVGEAETIETSSKLDKIVVGAALGSLVEIAGHAVGISVIGKIVAIGAAVAIGGVGVYLLHPFSDVDGTAPPHRSAPAAPVAAPRPQQAPAATVDSIPAAVAPQTPSGRSDVGVTSTRAAERTVTRATPRQTSRRNPLELGKQQPVEVRHSDKVRPRDE